ncbi:unnamed protein product [Gemmata massiliana]|uniref:Lipoprotein n=1 Tax=Gemmata massiliana TaxID=1210884 RepID=A0A6P2DFY1_9BACT|nr:hypothetical protein [Gemmata massiliana]VTR98644.1 unnamed protein product [Gemmata massiliana]
MRMSRTITLKLLGGLTLSGCCLASLGCGQKAQEQHEVSTEQQDPADFKWYDEQGKEITEKWKTDEHGNRVLDAEGRPIPEPSVPYDRHHRPWVWSNGAWIPLILMSRAVPHAPYSAPMHSHSSSSSSWLSGGSGYRTSSTTTTYRAGTGTGSRSVTPTPSAPAGSSISRGGFGSTGSSSSSSSSS